MGADDTGTVSEARRSPWRGDGSARRNRLALLALVRGGTHRVEQVVPEVLDVMALLVLVGVHGLAQRHVLDEERGDEGDREDGQAEEEDLVELLGQPLAHGVRDDRRQCLELLGVRTDPAEMPPPLPEAAICWSTAAGRWPLMASARPLVITVPRTAMPTVDPTLRKNCVEAVATPMSRAEAAFCTTSV